MTKPRKCPFAFFLSILLATSVYGQSTIDLSKNTTDNTISVPGTYLSIDTTGLNLHVSANPSVFINENDLTVLGIEQKQLSLEDYESVVGNMLKFDSIIIDNNVVFNEYKGKLILGIKSIQKVEKEIWIGYLGNQNFVIEIKGFYNSNLHSRYRASFEKVIKSLFIDSNRKMSIYEDLPFYLDENIFRYKKELSFMPQSIALSQEVNGTKRVITIAHFSLTREEIEDLRQGYINDSERCIINEKEIFTRVNKTDSRITIEGIIVLGNRLIQLQCSSLINDESAVSEFKEIAKSIEFK